MKKEILDKINSFAKKRYRKQQWYHINRTVKLAEFISKKEHGNIEICKISSLLHDIGLSVQTKNHNIFGKKIVDNFLKSINFDNQKKEMIVNCILAHNIPKLAKTKEAKIVYDADKLQLIGPLGICRAIYKGLTKEKIDLSEAIRKSEKDQKKYYKTLFTKTAKKMAKKPYELGVNFFKVLKIQDKGP